MYVLRSRDVPEAALLRELKKLKLSYCGEEVKPPQVLTQAQIQEGLPPKGAAASIRAAELAEDPVFGYLLDPRKAFIP